MSNQKQLTIRLDSELYQMAKLKCKKRLEKHRKGCASLPGPRLKDLYELSPAKPQMM